MSEKNRRRPFRRGLATLGLVVGAVATASTMTAPPAAAASHDCQTYPGGHLCLSIGNIYTTSYIRVMFTRTSGNGEDWLSLGWRGPNGVVHWSGHWARARYATETIAHTWTTYIGPGCSRALMSVDPPSGGRYVIETTKVVCAR